MARIRSVHDQDVATICAGCGKDDGQGVASLSWAGCDQDVAMMLRCGKGVTGVCP